MSGSWFSQPFPPEGASTAEGIRNQLGRPMLDLLTILVRESAQNSWDARVGGDCGPVDYAVDLRTIGPAHAPAWRELLCRNAPMNEHLPLRKSLAGPTIQVLTVSDRGTSGLGGPTRADDVRVKNHDFVSFVRNVGEPRDTELGGGTYGFGKGIFYLISRPGTILLHTRCKVDGSYETRLMGCALWASYVASEHDAQTRFTGRHWWGDNSGNVVEPLVGAEAESVASRLGLRPFGEEETGTTIVIIDPNLEDREPDVAANYIAETIAWHLWPKMVTTETGCPPMRFSVTCNGISYPVPDPREMWPLRLFVTAYEALEGTEASTLRCLRPKKDLGRLSVVKRTAPPVEPTEAARLVGIEQAVHHVCLMRQAELVVTYRPGPKSPTEFQHYAGVFKADSGLDHTYAMAEPPTHDAWNPQSLDYPDSTYVNTTFRRIDEALDGLLTLGGGVHGSTAKISLGAASTMFASLVGNAWGIGGATDYAKPGSTGTGGGDVEPVDPDVLGFGEGLSRTNEHRGNEMSGADGSASAESTPANGRSTAGDSIRDSSSRQFRFRVEYLGDPYYTEHRGESVLVQEFRLPAPGLQRVRAELGVALASAGGRETDPPVGAEVPRLIGWQDDSGAVHDGPTALVDGGTERVWRLVVRPARDTMTDLEIGTEGVQPL
ncbi:hypothetical protein [Amycolatopsis thermoflava]|uniref:hypothetical protein n=1 Tax=Amycolatopsis thermoflava TaxID=84480 RepID=UPI00381F720B